MSFLYPAFLIGAVAIAIPIALHFMRRDVAPEVPFSAVRLLRHSPVERTRRRRLRDLFLLAARVAALVLLALAFARPYASGAAAASGAVRIVAVDRSFSMGAPGRFAHALDLARRAIDEASAGERVAVVVFDDRADLIAGPGSAADARASLAGLQPGFGGTRYGPLFTKAAETADGAPGRVVVISDLQRAGWEDQQRAVLPATLALDVRDAGAPVQNVAVTAVRVAPDRVVASIRNGGRDRQAGQVRVERDGQRVASGSYDIPGDSTAEVPLPYRAPASGSIAVVVDDPAGFVADNTRYAVLDPIPPATTLVIASGNGNGGFYLSRALAAAADAGADAMDARVVTGSSVSSIPASEMSRQAAVVLLSTRGIDRRGREAVAGFVRGGGGLFVAASPEIDPSVFSTIFEWRPALSASEQAAGAVALSATDLRHPIFRPFGGLAANLGQVRFDRTWRVEPAGWDVAARFTDGTPALLERREGKGRVVLFTSDIDRRWNDFPLHPAFVPFAIEAVRYVSGGSDRGRDYAVARVPPGVQPQPGIHHAQPDGRAVAVNVDPRESATATLKPDEFDAMLDRMAARPAGALDIRAQQTEARQNYWRYGLMVMFGVLVLEAVVGRV